MTQNSKTFINGVFINEQTFPDGGSKLKLSIPADKIDYVAEQLKFNERNGYCRLEITRNRNPKISEKTGKPISTHSLSVDTWEPGQAKTQPTAPSPVQQRPAMVPTTQVTPEMFAKLKAAIVQDEPTVDVPF
jgi:hypothetical protein